MAATGIMLRRRAVMSAAITKVRCGMGTGWQTGADIVATTHRATAPRSSSAFPFKAALLVKQVLVAQREKCRYFGLRRVNDLGGAGPAENGLAHPVGSPITIQ
jgi:hypothetical protein